jgi:hypothetical protein
VNGIKRFPIDGEFNQIELNGSLFDQNASTMGACTVSVVMVVTQQA